MLRKLMLAAMTLLFVAIVTFLLLRVMPGGPFDNPKIPPDVLAMLNRRFYLDRPLLEQLGFYLRGLFQGDLGPSLVHLNRGVGEILWPAMVVSMMLGGFALLLGLPLGVLAAIFVTYASPQATVCRVLAQGVNHLMGFILATPSFVMAGALVLLFAVWQHWLPAATLGSFQVNHLAARQIQMQYWILPVISLACMPMATTFTILRGSLADLKTTPYVHAKKTLGLPPWHIAVHHVLRNAWMPLMALLGPMAANILTGSVAVETIFALPGLGKFFVSAVINRDFTLVMGVTLLYGTLLISLNLVSELAQGLLDPRLRQAASSG
ncbi:MAG: ABC transporter permease [Vampirovibrionales bacterium]|nr:ABC transporter permease [Vampirovibrionales bacterium]